jgi:hypothetical protein
VVAVQVMFAIRVCQDAKTALFDTLDRVKLADFEFAAIHQEGVLGQFKGFLCCLAAVVRLLWVNVPQLF